MGNEAASRTLSLEKARSYLLRLLKFRPRSEAELKGRLARRGFGQPTVDSLLEEFKRKGFIDDAKFARYLVTSRMLSKPMGKRALLLDLKAKGVESDLAQQAVDEAGGPDELEVARELALTRISHLKGLESEAVQRRLFGFLSRRGFSSDIIYRVVREMTKENVVNG